MFSLLKKFLIFVVSIFVLTTSSFLAYAQTSTPSPTPDSSQQVSDLQKRIAELEAKVSDLKSKGNSLSSQISAMDNQIKLTEYRINATQQQITDLTLDIDSTTKRMASLEGSLNDLTKTLLHRIVATYQTGGAGTMEILLFSSDVDDLVSRANYLRLVQAHDKQLLYDTKQAQNDYANQKTIFEDKKKKIEALKAQLEDYNKQLDQDKKTKQELLAVTKNDEARYQKLLAEAKAQISSFKSFASFQGGASILPPQPSPDGWFYNQRDSRWGTNNIGSSSEKVWEVGCLLTSVAMVKKKHGDNVTPADIAANSSYFFSNTAYMLIPWAGGEFTSSWGSYSSIQGGIDSKLASGEPVIVGVKAGPYGTHFVVFKSGSNGNYVINDPWHGPDLNFGDYYSTGQIFQYGWHN